MKASQWAGIYCNDSAFQAWLSSPAGAEFAPLPLVKPEGPLTGWCAVQVRAYCGVTSRSEIATNPEAKAKWHRLATAFKDHCNRSTTCPYCRCPILSHEDTDIDTIGGKCVKAHSMCMQENMT